MGEPFSFRWQFIFEAALQSYERQTGTKLVSHPLARQLEDCNSVESITAVLQEQACSFSQFRRDGDKAMGSLTSAVHVLYALSTSTTLGEGIGLVRQMVLLKIAYY
jgi:hypothetical protein